MNLLLSNRLLKLSLLLAVFQLSNALYAQGICYDFEATCDNSVPNILAFNEPFFQGCVPDWNSAYGTPQILYNAAFIGFWQEECIIGEGIVLENIPFTDCVNIQFNYREEGANISEYTIQLFAIPGSFPAVTGGADECDDTNWVIPDVPDIPMPLIPIWEITGEGLQTGQNYTAVIDEANIPEGTQQLWFRIAPLPDAELIKGDRAGILIDDFCYVSCDACEDPMDDEQTNEDCLLNEDALFYLETDVNLGVYTFYPESFESYEDLLGEHSWRVLISGSEGGPYQDLGVFETEDFPMVREEGLFYTVIHTVTYLCGTFCYLQRTCSTSLECDNCGPICCDTDLDYCNPKAPTNLDCTYEDKEGIILTWDATPGADGYQVDFVETEVVPGDIFSICNLGASGLYGPTVDDTTPTNSIPEPDNISMCYEFRVRSLCNGAPGLWSEWANVTEKPCKQNTGGDGPGPSLGGDKTVKIINDNPIVYPNPSTDFFNIILPQQDESTKIRVFDFSGREVYKKVLESSQESPLKIHWGPSSFQSKGIYLLVIEQGENMTTHKLILE